MDADAFLREGEGFERQEGGRTSLIDRPVPHGAEAREAQEEMDALGSVGKRMSAKEFVAPTTSHASRM